MKIILFFVSLLLLSGCSKEFVRYHGHKYKAIQAGDQYWMAENLATKSYRSGKKIPFITDYSIWPEMMTPGCGTGMQLQEGSCVLSNGEYPPTKTGLILKNTLGANSGLVEK